MFQTGLKEWLSTKGLKVEDALVRDVACGQVQVQQQNGFFSFNTPIQMPYLPLVQKFPQHPVTKGLERVILQFASPLSYGGDARNVFTPLLLSSDKSASENIPLVFDIQRQWTQSDFPQSNICMGRQNRWR